MIRVGDLEPHYSKDTGLHVLRPKLTYFTALVSKGYLYAYVIEAIQLFLIDQLVMKGKLPPAYHTTVSRRPINCARDRQRHTGASALRNRADGKPVSTTSPRNL
ncbi:hypothetical protein PG995_001216 [Apiospora arundinis]